MVTASPSARPAAGAAADGVVPGTAALGDLPLLDLELLHQLTETLGQQEFRQIFALVPEVMAREQQALRQALTESNRGETRRAAHTLHGLASSFGALRLAGVSKAVLAQAPRVAPSADGADYQAFLAQLPPLLALLNETIDLTAAAIVRWDQGAP